MESRLQKFVCLVESGTFTAAAERLHLSQPALTTAIQKLERELKCELIVRGSHRVLPTAAGQLAYASAKELRTQLDNLSMQLQQLAGERPLLRMGMIDSVAFTLFVQQHTLPMLQRQAHVALSVNNSSHLLAALHNDDLDCIFAVRQINSYLPTMQVQTIGSEPLVLVAHESHAAAVARALRKRELSGLLSYNAGSATYQLITRALQARRIEPEIAFYSTSPEIMLQLVRAGQGVAILPYLMVRDDMAAGTLVHIRIKGLVTIGREIVMVIRRGRQLPPVVADFAARTTATLTQLSRSAVR